ncbi:putative triacylglycerol lipase [Helianthus annuus]|uniref:Triacylglycerol lipase n=1 Tax=Helianthus annuus TaxID=4232 RepID=A0A9K3JSK6_HELAN|nr:GDSL esterase/lipase At5g45670 [Helianthus annuus]KAF5821036.1 putative triacylglycerol lipase [Helianthus annuus]KAJ0610762.1 putative triacylglycerol lipase [Helianthus annuus]KAJ0621561.1 putative triacylglycerol lipase [Helianthus annuus]
MATAQNLVILMFTTTLLLANCDPQVPCYFIFGDSLMDNGNNNHLLTQAKVNFPPYGIDFPDGPTGRFNNGRNTSDVIAQLLGFDKFIPPFAIAKGGEILTGVNYASGAAGIRAETAKHLGGRISMDNQIKNHWTTIIRLTYLIGKGSLVETKKYLKKCIYTVGMGNNDYINNYFLPKYYNTSSVYTPEQYAEALVEQYSRQLQELYKSGARMFGVFAAGDSGCTPGMMAEFGMNSCVDEVNSAVMLFNSRLNMTLNDLNNRFDDAKFILIEGSREYPNDINVTDTPCCGGSSTSDKGQCAPNQVPCSNRQNYYFWDAFHPTERINVIAGKRAYEKLTSFEAFRTIALSKDKETGYISVA